MAEARIVKFSAWFGLKSNRLVMTNFPRK